MTARYNISESWQWNLENAPALTATDTHDAVPGNWAWCGKPIPSPLGIPAGPLLNGRWVLHYANLGFDVLVYKTVRSAARECYDLPNLVPVATKQLTAPGELLPQSSDMLGSWAVSFGMPSQLPDVWRRDVEETRGRLASEKLLVVSVVGTQNETITDPDASLNQLADDFAQCAKWALESGADGVEANFSCPNVSTADGQLFQQPTAAAFVAQRIRTAIGDAKLVLKIGRVATEDDAAKLLKHVGPWIDGLAMTNSVAARVTGPHGQLLFEGQSRGICGDATRETSVQQTSMFRKLATEAGQTLDLIGVGGISTAEHVQQFLQAGANSVAIATAAMVQPEVGLKIRQALS
ncbi:hypothetical protein [Fuerstiella marisgermanici]|uniref:Dihydroorotate dehydrogenase B (NAD(+)), catalytic subunit n=1 Tax=Fuerstiella marisgermanici TaxID=1891926 RepID=A0A1P8WHN5_9PLAN|nr:hypothetical protein [Fuerstiella marisgermanici]APZ93570.1 Dihydroorotate dehydrogenase B (NAD(+)), catalytic subunit [Fuerstiella marisgermanici]